MGIKPKRTEGKKKRKSIKAKITSTSGSKRKLSRMGKKQKRAHRGEAAAFISRSQALRKLQLSLKDFRRLCILKGIYPRDPKKGNVQTQKKVFYHTKDISYINHEPLLNHFREIKAFMKKVNNAANRNEVTEAHRKMKGIPKYTLDHLVKERYPRFKDALNDLDDNLCLLYLFAALPVNCLDSPKRSNQCKIFCREWEYYIMQTHSLNKVFISVKGIYLQAEVEGAQVTWLMPHPFSHSTPKEVDYRVMSTFLEFAEVLLKFTLFKLYHSIGLKYPPSFNKKLQANGALMESISTTPFSQQGKKKNAPGNDKKKSQKESLKISAKEKGSVERIATLDEKLKQIDVTENDEDEEGHHMTELSTTFEDAFDKIDYEDEPNFVDTSVDSDTIKSTLFKKLKFFLSREVPIVYFEFIIRSFGGEVGWDGPGSYISKSDLGITHFVIDRPRLSEDQKASCEYIQPQWVIDSINSKILLPVSRYAPGIALPPHLSPFVDEKKEGYIPKYQKEIEQLKSVQQSLQDINQVKLQEIEDGQSNEDEEESEEEDEEKTYAEELEAERKGVKYSTQIEKKKETKQQPKQPQNNKKANNKKKQYSEKEKIEIEERKMKTMMMTGKAKRLYTRMQHGINTKQRRVETLDKKRQKSENFKQQQQQQANKKNPKKD